MYQDDPGKPVDMDCYLQIQADPPSADGSVGAHIHVVSVELAADGRTRKYNHQVD